MNYQELSDKLNFPKELILRNGEVFTADILRLKDAAILSEFFTSLKKETLKRYGPHPMIHDEAYRICHELPSGLKTWDQIRIIARNNGRGLHIAAYFLFMLGFNDYDAQRYYEHGVSLNPDATLTFAPVLSDDYQSCGLGSLLMNEALKLPKLLNRRTIVLWGRSTGLQQSCSQILRKIRFQKKGEFEYQGTNFNMVLFL